MTLTSRIKNDLDKDVASFGIWQTLPGANLARLLARTPGIGWILLDCEHGNIDDGAMHDCVPAIAATGVSPIVRIPGTEPWMIKRALDCGAHGILVPLLRTPEEAKAIVSASKFPPMGTRGFGSPFSMDRFQPVPTAVQYLQQANDTLVTMIQIETQEALDNIDAIAAVDGIDVLFVGPFDLGNSIGHPIVSASMAPELEAAIARILEAAKKAGKTAGIFSASAEQAKLFASQGFKVVGAGGTDCSVIAAAMAQRASTAMGVEEAKKGVTY